MENTELLTAAMTGAGKPQDTKLLEMVKTLPALNPKDVADAVLYVLSTPSHVQVHELTIKPLGEPF